MQIKLTKNEKKNRFFIIFFSLFLFQAAILQQTAEYIYALEQEKTRLLSQNCQLKRLLDQNDNVAAAAAGELQTTNKKRKFDNVIQMQTISDSSDEGLGSMSPEPVTIFTVLQKNNQQQQQQQSIGPIKDIVEMKQQLEIERRQRINAEEQLRQLECQIFPERIRDVPIHYQQHQEVIEHTNNIRDEEMTMSLIPESLPKDQQHQQQQHHHLLLHDDDDDDQIAQNQVVICSTELDQDDDETEDCCDEDDDDELRSESPILLQQQHPIILKDELIIQQQQHNVGEIIQLQKRPVTPTLQLQLQSPPPVTVQRLQPILEAAIKAEPKVEVERINSPVKTNDEQSTTTTPATTAATDKTSKNQSRMFVTTSRQNLETIVEAIRHLEGDHLFGETIEPTQEAPLALTNKPTQQQQQQPPQITRQLQFEMNPFLQFRNSTTTSTTSNQLALTSTQTAISHHQLQQQRPGVIVVKQNS